MNNSIIWITGANGFIGKYLTQSLLDDNEHIVCFNKNIYTSSTIGSKKNIAYKFSLKSMLYAMDKHGVPKKVYHLAGSPTVGQSFIDPHNDFISNVGTVETLLNALHGNKTQIIFTSSAAVYGECKSKKINVDDILSPWSPYGHHKVIAEQLLKSYSNFNLFGITIIRLFSVYGAGLRKQLLYDICRKLSLSKKNDPLILSGTGHEKRDWIEVNDVISVLKNLDDAQSGSVNIFNLGTGVSYEIQDIASKLVFKWGGSKEIIFDETKRNGDPYSLVSDPRSLPPNFNKKTSIDEGIERYLSWFKSFKHEDQ